MASSLIYTFLFFLTVFVLFRLYYSTRPPTTKKPPPSPPKLPIIGNLHQLGPLIHRSLFSLSRRYAPDLMLVYMGSVPTVVVSSAKAARELMRTHDLKVSGRPFRERYDIYSYGYKEILFAPYGERWKQTKKLLVHNILSATKVQSYSRLRHQEVAAILHKITDLSRQKRVINFTELFLEYTENITCRATFGKRLYWDTGLKVFHDIKILFSFFFEDTNPHLAWVDRVCGKTAKVKALRSNIDEFMESVINERLARKGTHDLGEGVEPLIDALLRIQKEGMDGLVIDRDVIKVLLMDSYLAAAETSSAMLEWVMTELLSHPSILKKLQLEVKTIINGKQEITDDDLTKMKYMKAVIMETARLHPPAPVGFPHLTTEDIEVMGYEIPKGTDVYINLWGIGRDPAVWDRADEFVPERFVGSSSEVDFVNHNYQLLPFGAGRRGCPGRVFAMAMDEILLANILYKYDLALPDNVNHEDGEYMDEALGTTLHKKTPLLALVTPITST